MPVVIVVEPVALVFEPVVEPVAAASELDWLVVVVVVRAVIPTVRLWVVKDTVDSTFYFSDRPVFVLQIFFFLLRVF